MLTADAVNAGQTVAINALTFTPTKNLNFQIDLTRVLLDCGRKLEDLERTHPERRAARI